MSRNPGNPRGGRPSNRPENPLDDIEVDIAAGAEPADVDVEIGESNWAPGNWVHTESHVVQYGYQEPEEAMQGQMPEVTGRRVVLHDSPTSRRRRLQEGVEVVQGPGGSPTLRRRRSFRSVMQRLSPRPTRRRSTQCDSSARSGSEPPTGRRNRGTQTPPMSRKWGPDDRKD